MMPKTKATEPTTTTEANETTTATAQISNILAVMPLDMRGDYDFARARMNSQGPS